MAEAMKCRSFRPVAIAGRPLFSLLLPIPLIAFFATLLVDIAYARSANLVWLYFSSWLLFAGLFFGAIAALILLIDAIRSPGIRAGAGWAAIALFYAALLVGLVNIFVHSRDGWTAVVPQGLTLSVIASLLMLIAAALWPAVAQRERR